MPTNGRTTVELLAALCDEAISPDEMRRLDRLIVSDAAVRRQYLEYLDIHARLSCQFHQPLDASPAMPSVRPVVFLSPPRSSLSPDFVGGPVFSYMVATLVLCLMLLGAWAHKVSLSQQESVVNGKNRRPAVEEFAFVGRVTGMKDCVWAKDGLGTIVGASVPFDREYILSSGLLEITYTSGARVILEGPCDFKADSDAGGYLAIGKLTARIERRGKSEERRGLAASAAGTNHQATTSQPSAPSPQPLFAVRTPTAVVTDLGTEFGVIVDKNGNTDTHVLEGIVKVNISGNTHESIRLAVGESVRVEKTNEGNKHVVTRGKADVTAFPIHPGELAAMLEKERLGRFRRWQDFGKKLLNRKDLVAYYDFQPVKNNRLLLRDRTSKFGPDSQDTNIEGAYWVPGRFPGKYALRFTSSYHAAQIRVDGLAGSRQLTLAAWVLVDQMSQNVIYLLTTEVQSSRDASGDNVAVGSVNWGLKPNGMMGLAGKSDKRRGTLVLYSPVRAIGKNQLHRWCFLAVTCDIDAGETVFYRNDQCLGIKMGHTLSDTETFSGLPCDIVRPGASRPLDISESRRFFQGSIGEIMVFRKALSPEEIRDIYQTSNPSVENGKQTNIKTSN